MIRIDDSGSPRIAALTLTGKLTDADYRTFIPTIEARLAAEGMVRLLVRLEDFHGWDLHAAWDDFCFGIKHSADFDRFALVGDQGWEEWMAKLCRPFTKAEVRYFPASEFEAARAWIAEGL